MPDVKAHGAGRVERLARGRALPLVPAIVGLLFAGVTLTREPVWGDELASLALVDRSFPQLLAAFPHEHNGILFHFVLWAFVHVGGTSSVVLRLPALLAFVGAIFVCHLLGKRLASAVVGLLGCGLLAIHPFAIRYAQEGRMYAFALLFVLVSTLALTRAMQQPSRRAWVAYVAAVVAAGYSHDFALLAIAAHPLLVRDVAPSTRRAFWISLALAAALLAPLVVLAGLDWGSEPLYWLGSPNLQTVRNGVGFLFGSVYIAVWFAVIAAIAWFQSKRSLPLGLLVFLGAWLAAPAAVLIATSFIKPLFIDRYVIESIPAFCIAAALLVVRLGRIGVPALLVLACLLVVETIHVEATYSNPALPELASYLQEHRLPGEQVIVVGDPRLEVNGLLYYDRRLGISRSRLLWTPADLKRVPRGIAIADTRPGHTGTPAFRPGINWVVNGDGSEQHARCTDDQAMRFRGVTLERLSGCR